MSKTNKPSVSSNGVHSNVDKKITKALRSAYLRSGIRAINQLKAFKQGKRVVVTVENPNKNETNKRFIKVLASTIWKK